MYYWVVSLNTFIHLFQALKRHQNCVSATSYQNNYNNNNNNDNMTLQHDTASLVLQKHLKIT